MTGIGKTHERSCSSRWCSRGCRPEERLSFRAREMWSRNSRIYGLLGFEDLMQLRWMKYRRGTAFYNTMTYVGHKGEVEQPWVIEFNHGMAEIITAVMDAGLDLIAIEEHDSVSWAALEDQMELLPNGEYRLIDRPERLPHSYTLQARRR